MKGGKVTYTIGRFEYEDGKPKQCLEKYGIGMTLPSIANIRGFNGSQFEDVVFDEFIPERIVIKRKAEGDALLNAYVTINGNRELEGKPRSGSGFWRMRLISRHLFWWSLAWWMKSPSCAGRAKNGR